MNGIIVELLTIARKVNNRIVDATDNAATNAKWDSTTGQKYVVPTGKRWRLLSSQVQLDVSATLAIYHRDSSDNIIALLANYTAGTGVKPYPTAPSYTAEPVILDAGEYVDIDMNNAQGAGASASCVVLEIPYP